MEKKIFWFSIHFCRTDLNQIQYFGDPSLGGRILVYAGNNEFTHIFLRLDTSASV